MIFLLIKTICKTNDVEIFIEKSFSVLIKKIQYSGEIVVYDEFIIYICTTNSNLCSFRIFI